MNGYKADCENSTSPREDLSKYGEKMVQEGKLSRSKLAMIKRWER